MIHIESQPILVDYGLLRRDFPDLLSDYSEAQIKQWLLDRASFFREDQIKENQKSCHGAGCIHGPVPLHPNPTRCKGYASGMAGRSVLVAIDQDRFIDLKGSGADKPRFYDMHSNGVLSLSVAIHEFMMSKIVRRIGQSQDDPFDAVDCYAVLHVPAWLHTKDHKATVLGNNTWAHEFINSPGSREDIAILVRQAAHRTSSIKDYVAPLSTQIRLESALRSFGLTSLVSPYDEVYPRHDASPRPEFQFFDAQLAGLQPAFIDFTQVRIVSLEEAAASQEDLPVYPVEVIFFNPQTKEGCYLFQNGLLQKNESQCREYLQTLTPQWYFPPITSADYLLPAGDVQWRDFHRNDFSTWFEEPLKSEIYRLTFQSSLLFGLSEDPHIYQTIFTRLTFLLENWSSNDHNLQTTELIY